MKAPFVIKKCLDGVLAMDENVISFRPFDLPSHHCPYYFMYDDDFGSLSGAERINCKADFAREQKECLDRKTAHYRNKNEVRMAYYRGYNDALQGKPRNP